MWSQRLTWKQAVVAFTVGLLLVFGFQLWQEWESLAELGAPMVEEIDRTIEDFQRAVDREGR